MMPRQAPTLDESGNVTLQLTVDGVEAMYRWERSSDTLTRVLAEGEACPGDLGDTVTDMEPPPTPGNYLGRVDLVSNRGDVFTTYTCAAAGEQWGRLDAGALALRPLFAEGTTIAGPSGETMELRHRDLYGPMVTAPNGDLWMFAIGYCPSDAMCLPGGGTSLYGLLHYDAAASRWEMAPWASDPSFCADTGPMENMRQPVTLSVSEESELAFFAYVQDGTSTGPPGIFVRRLGATHLVAREIAPTDYALGHADDLIFNGGSLHLLPGGEALFNIPGAAGTGISSTWVTASRDSGLTAVLGPDSEVDLTPLETLTVRIVEQFVVGRDGDTYAKALLSDIRERTILRGRTVVARDGDTMVDELDGSRVELGEADLMDLTYGGGNQTEGASRGDSITVAGNGSDGRPYVVTERAVLARTAGGVVVLLNGDPRPDPSGMSTNMGDGAVTLTAVVEDAAIRWTVVVQNVGDEPATIEAVRLSGASGGATLAIQPPLPSDCVETAAPVGVPWEVVCATPFALDPGATRTFEILTDRDPDGSAVVAEAAIEVTNDPFTMDNVATATASRSGADLRLEVVVPGEDPDIGTSPYLRLLNAYNDGPDTAVYVVVHAELRTTLSGAELWLGDGTSGMGPAGPPRSSPTKAEA